jgi:energy-coupling factor transporter ATP-binding protein EcfA2
LPIGEKGLVVYGANGTGKSSIIDALEFALSGRSTLYPVNRQGVSWENGAPHVRDGTPDIAVDVNSGDQTLILFPGGEPNDLSEADAAWIATARSASFVLRRHMLLQFISGEPRNRYDLLEPFMNLGTYQDVENRLREWNDSLETARTGVAATVTELEPRLHRVFDPLAAGSLTEAALLEQLNTTLRRLGLPDCSDMGQLEARQDAVAAQLGGTEQTQRLAALGNLRTQAQGLGRGQDLAELVGSLASALEELEREISSRTEEVLTDLLMRGKEVIEAAGLETCPLCEQPVDRSVVLARLKERIQADERITAARNLVKARRRVLQEHTRPLAQAMRQFVNDWAGTVQEALPAGYGYTRSVLDELVVALEAETITSTQVREFLSRLKATITSHDGVIRRIDEMIQAEGGGERRAALDAAASMIESLLTNWPRYKTTMAHAGKLRDQKDVIARLHGHAVEARKGAVQATLEEVAETANRFYERIHPAENVATSRLVVRHVGQGSVNLSTQFDGRDEHPLLHYSESHLNTLGLCYFLALRKNEAKKMPAFKVLVLDDVMHSVDAAHRARIAELLKQEFGAHQIVITTHDLPFYEALRRTFGSGGYTYRRINNWDLERGPVLGDPLTDHDRITDPAVRETLSQETLAAAGGRFFEWLLREVTERLGVAVPAWFSREHDIGNLWPPLAAKLKRHHGFASTHQALVNGLEQNGWVRNTCGAHYNAPASPPTLPEVQEFAALLAELYHVTFCSNCRNFITKQGNGGWRCECDRISFPARQIDEDVSNA